MGRKDPKPPKNLPVIGDRCRLRGRSPHGTLRTVSERAWTEVEWDQDKPGPVIVHHWELERVEPPIHDPVFDPV